MNDTSLKAAPEWAAFRRWYFVIAALLASLLLLLWLAGYGPGGTRCQLPAAPVAAAPAVAAPAPATPAAPPAAAPPAATVAATPTAAATVTAAASVAATPPVAAASPVPAARVYFGLDKTALPRDVDQTLAEVVAYLKANGSAKALVSGFHDPSGNPAHNEELALNRARAVRAQLDKLGIPNDRVEMAKPAVTTGTGVAREARRVEVSVRLP